MQKKQLSQQDIPLLSRKAREALERKSKRRRPKVFLFFFKGIELLYVFIRIAQVVQDFLRR